jgi:hypothetical protein
MRSDVRQKLIDVAKRGKTITYGELMEEFGIPRGNPKPGVGIGAVVGDISQHENDQGRPLISAIVVRAQTGTEIRPKGTPGGGFFGLPGIPNHLNRPASEHSNQRLTEEEQQFIKAEQQRVWEYWRSH